MIPELLISTGVQYIVGKVTGTSEKKLLNAIRDRGRRKKLEAQSRAVLEATFSDFDPSPECLTFIEDDREMFLCYLMRSFAASRTELEAWVKDPDLRDEVGDVLAQARHRLWDDDNFLNKYVICTPQFQSKLTSDLQNLRSAIEAQMASDLEAVRNSFGNHECILVTSSVRFVMNFIGRSDEMSQLSNLCTPGTITFVSGKPGSGRSTLVRQYLSRLSGCRIVCVEHLTSVMDTVASIPVHGFVDSMYPDVRERFQAKLSFIDSPDVVLAIDGCPGNPNTRMFEGLSCAVIIITDTHPSDGNSVRVGPMPHGDSVRLLESLLDPEMDYWMEEHRDETESLVDVTALPADIVKLAEAINDHPFNMGDLIRAMGR